MRIQLALPSERPTLHSITDDLTIRRQCFCRNQFAVQSRQMPFRTLRASLKGGETDKCSPFPACNAIGREESGFAGSFSFSELPGLVILPARAGDRVRWFRIEFAQQRTFDNGSGEGH